MISTSSCVPMRLALSKSLSLSAITAMAVFLLGAAFFATNAGAAKRNIKIVALGDSFSSGTGLGSVSSGCDRDAFAYARRASRDILPSSHRIAGFTWAACSGAKTGDVWEKQLKLVKPAHNVASLTIGGNDVGFGKKVLGCYLLPPCDDDLMSLSADVGDGPQTWDDLYANLVTTYIAIRRRMARYGNLYVLTYPIPFSRDAANCWLIDANSQNAGNALSTRLGDTIYWAINRANELLRTKHRRPGNVRFVDWRTGSRQVGGYVALGGVSFDTYASTNGLCSSAIQPNVFVNGATAPPNHSNSFHPNSNGYWHAASRLSTEVRRFQP